ncbi:MAG: histidine kinase [Reichenbachiella sp.]|uniref:sensor histidine kinase n=1 Tax=Reichenbachiella sp. TaxID=2184521 RepID=UPI003264BFAE
MKFSLKIILYIGISGILPTVFFTILKLINHEFEGSFLYICGNFFFNAGLSYLMTVLVAIPVMYTLIKIDQHFPWHRNAIIRFALDFFITPLVAMIAITPLAYLTFVSGLDFKNNYLREHMINQVLTALIMDLILVGAYEGYYFFNLWKASLIKNEQLEKENITSRYEALKNQINPHFLFNSLNTVSSLIHEDPHKAEEFIDEFSKIYRFLLENQDKNLHSLEDELKFVKSYLSLQQIRFGDSLSSSIDVEADKLPFMIPMLSLQLLVENAIKHNQITKEHPLEVAIDIEDDFLVVKNTLRLRAKSLDSTGIGINNLNARYEMLANLAPVFIKTDKEYVAKLPLIKEMIDD